LQPPIFKLCRSLQKFFRPRQKLFQKRTILIIHVFRNLFQEMLYIIKIFQIIGFCSFYNTVNDCGRFGSMNRINQSSANSSFYVLKNITGKTGSASPNGATANATVYTMVEMAKTNALNTYKYLTYLLSQRPNDKMSNEQLEQLAPWSDTAKVNYQN